MISIVRRGLLVLLALLPMLGNAAATPSAHDLVDRTTKELLSDLAANKEQYKSNPGAFYDALNR
ncbi:MAG: toluene tolerance protein, partial [Pseudomonas caspiana]